MSVEADYADALAAIPDGPATLVGFHFRDAVETGIKHGEKIGERAVNLYLRPAP